MARNFLKFFRKGNRFGHGNRVGNGANRFGRGRDNGFGNKGTDSSRKSMVVTISDKRVTSLVCLKCDLPPNDWIVDSAFTKHMTMNSGLFTMYKEYDGGHVIFGRNLKGKVIGR
ncbi:hypothetical protein Tco_1520244, partial [Tanacetum coccineum]